MSRTVSADRDVTCPECSRRVRVRDSAHFAKHGIRLTSWVCPMCDYAAGSDRGHDVRKHIAKRHGGNCRPRPHFTHQVTSTSRSSSRESSRRPRPSCSPEHKRSRTAARPGRGQAAASGQRSRDRVAEGQSSSAAANTTSRRSRDSSAATPQRSRDSSAATPQCSRDSSAVQGQGRAATSPVRCTRVTTAGQARDSRAATTPAKRPRDSTTRRQPRDNAVVTSADQGPREVTATADGYTHIFIGESAEKLGSPQGAGFLSESEEEVPLTPGSSPEVRSVRDEERTVEKREQPKSGKLPAGSAERPVTESQVETAEAEELQRVESVREQACVPDYTIAGACQYLAHLSPDDQRQVAAIMGLDQPSHAQEIQMWKKPDGGVHFRFPDGSFMETCLPVREMNIVQVVRKE